MRQYHDLIRRILADFPCKPFGQFQLHDGRYDTLRLFGYRPRQPLAQRTADQPLDPCRSVDDTHQRLSIRSR